MTTKIYKYMSADILEKASSVNGYFSFKCSYPKDFNDPYELFLTIDFQQSPELLAYYQEVIGKLPQLPTTCFSKSPSIIPMWAHYAHNHRGVVVEVDEDKISEHFPDLGFGDVDYRDTASEALLDMLHRAYSIGKARYHYFLQRGVFSAAYYTKQSCWSYELERRVIAREDEVIQENGLTLLRLPVECVTAFIIGHNATEETKTAVAMLAGNISASYYDMKIGKSTAQPYFIDSNNLSHEFSESALSVCASACENCREPTTDGEDICAWCAIEQRHVIHAVKNNPMRMLDRAGLLDGYYKDMDDVGKE